MFGQHLAAWLQKIRRNSHLFGGKSFTDINSFRRVCGRDT